MKSSDIVLSERAYVGGASPPALFEDESRFGGDIDGTHTDITWVKLPSGLWVRSYNGSSSFVQLGQDLFENDYKGGILTWVKADDFDDTRVILSASIQPDVVRVLMFGANNAGKLLVQHYNTVVDARNDVVTSTNALTAGKWQHCGFVSDGSDWSVYIDGALETPIVVVGSNTGAWFADQPAGTQDVRLGKVEYATTPTISYMKGDMGLTKIFRYPPSAEQIAAIFQAERSFFGV